MTILTVDDHPIVLEGLGHVLKDAGYDIICAGDVEEALRLADESETIDLFLFDLSIDEGTDGLTLLQTLRDKGFQQPVVIYARNEELWNISLLMEADVEGIVLKKDDVAELLAAIKEVANGGFYRSSSFSERFDAVKDARGMLSEKDIEVLRRLSRGESSRDIAKALGLSEKSIEYHRSRILRKLGTKNMTEATRRALHLGIIHLIAPLIPLPLL